MSVNHVGFEEFANYALTPLTRLATLIDGPEIAEDLAQECLIRVGTRWNRVQGRGDAMAYARTTLVRLAVDRHRRSKRGWIALQKHGARQETEPRGADVAADVGVEPWLAEAWALLSPNQRVSIGLRYLYDVDVNEIASELGCSASTVRSHLSRGLDRLRSRAPEGLGLEELANG